MVDSFHDTPGVTPGLGGQDNAEERVDFKKYDRRSLSYATTFEDPWKAQLIRAIELFTGKLTIVRLIREFERRGAPRGQEFRFIGFNVRPYRLRRNRILARPIRPVINRISVVGSGTIAA